MGRELDFGSHVGDRPKKNIFLGLQYIQYGLQVVIYAGAIVYTQIKIWPNPQIVFRLEPKPMS